MSVKSIDLSNKIFHCTRDEKDRKSEGTQEIYGLFHRICRAIPADLREGTKFEADKVTVLVSDPEIAKSLVKNVNHFSCYLGHYVLSGGKPIAELDKDRVVINFHHCESESER